MIENTNNNMDQRYCTVLYVRTMIIITVTYCKFTQTVTVLNGHDDNYSTVHVAWSQLL
jgi:hypothetical protein